MPYNTYNKTKEICKTLAQKHGKESFPRSELIDLIIKKGGSDTQRTIPSYLEIMKRFGMIQEIEGNLVIIKPEGVKDD